MKKTITTLTIALLICAQSQAQSCNTGQEGAKPSPDAKMVSSCVKGNNRVTTWLVKKSATDNENNEFSVKYKVNLSRLISSYDNNHSELVKLRAFIDGLMADKQNQITKFEITGYASPDGSMAVNERLANERAADCCSYIKKEYPDMAKIPCTTNGVAQPWSATKSAVESSSIPMKSEVVKLIESDMSDTQIESKLRAMPTSWSYMVSKILPPMRCVEIQVVYTTWERMVTRTPIRTPQPQRENIVVENNYFVVVEENPAQLIAFESDTTPLDFPRDKDKFKVKDRRRKAKLKGEYENSYGRHKYLWKSR